MKSMRLYLRGNRSTFTWHVVHCLAYNSPSFLPHLSYRISNIKRTNFFVVLEFEELISAVTGEIEKHI